MHLLASNRRRARTIRVLQLALLALVAGYSLSAFTALGPFSEAVDQWFNNLAYGGGALLLVLRAAWVRTDRAAWTLLAFAMVCYTAANAYYFQVLAELEPVPFPSLADAGWLAIYPCGFMALGLLLRPHLPRFQASMWLDGLLAALGAASISTAFVLDTVLDGLGGGFAAVATTLAYPTLDLVMIAFLMGMFALFRWRPDPAWLVLAGGLLAFAVADTGYLFAIARDTYAAGGVLDLVWMVGVVLIGLAAWRPRSAIAAGRLDGWRIVVVPGLFTSTSLGLLTYATVGHVSTVATTLAAVTLVVALVRTGLTFREVSALADARLQARTDELTGLPNRRSFMEQLFTAVDGREGEVGPAVLLIDLDRFKEVNDSFGHHVGDALLKMVGPRLRAAVRDADTIARLGGDEFGVVLHGADRVYASRIAARTRTALRRPFELEGLSVHLDASVGIALCPQHGDGAGMLLQRADIAMYEAKAARTGHEVYTQDHDSNARHRFETLQELRTAITDGQLVVHYQPKVHVATGAVVGVEALVRWQHPTRGLLHPDTFLGLAETAGLMRLLTLDVLDKALRQVRAWREEGMEISVAVNLSVSNLQDVGLPGQVALLLDSIGVPPESLELEITESVLMGDPDRALQVLCGLRALGLRLAVDDYGTGYSSLSYLRQLPVDELKLDKTFVMHMDEDPRSAAIVHSTIRLAHSLGMVIVAEGVENAQVLRQLAASGCDLAQGYHIGRPASAVHMTTWLRSRLAHGLPRGRRASVPDGGLSQS